MRASPFLVVGVALVGVLRAEPTSPQIAARRTATREFTALLVSAAKQDGALGLTIKELESVLGEKDETKETETLLRTPKWIYHLSDGRQLEVIKSGDGVSLAAVVGGKKVELVWK